MTDIKPDAPFLSGRQAALSVEDRQGLPTSLAAPQHGPPKWAMYLQLMHGHEKSRYPDGAAAAPCPGFHTRALCERTSIMHLLQPLVDGVRRLDAITENSKNWQNASKSHRFRTDARKPAWMLGGARVQFPPAPPP